MSMIHIVPFEGKYVYVVLVWRHKGLTIFSGERTTKVSPRSNMRWPCRQEHLQQGWGNAQNSIGGSH